MLGTGPVKCSEWARLEATATSADGRCGTGRRLCRWRRWRSVESKVTVYVEHCGARATRRTRVAQMASSRRRTLHWLAGVEAGLSA